MPRTHKIGDQWRNCDRCEILTPLSRLVIEDGLKLCDRGCRDNLDDNIRQRLIGRILSVPSEENTDRTAKLYYAPNDWDERI